MVVISSSLENIYLENILKISAFVMKKISISFKCFSAEVYSLLKALLLFGES